MLGNKDLSVLIVSPVFQGDKRCGYADAVCLLCTSRHVTPSSLEVCGAANSRWAFIKKRKNKKENFIMLNDEHFLYM